MILKIDSKYFSTQHQTAGPCEENAMDMHFVYCQNQILKHYFDKCQILKGSLLNRMVWLKKKKEYQMCKQIEYLRSYNNQYTKSNFSQQKQNWWK